MDIRTFTQLTTPDERSLHFTPLGLSTRGMISPEDAAAFQQRSIAAADLVPAVPEGTRSSFERLRTMHSYGLLCYDLFTVVDDLTWIVLEQALHERFIAFYGGGIPIVRNGVEDTFPSTDLEAMNAAFRRHGSHEGWRLRPRTPGDPIPVPLNLNARLRWARQEQLLHGQRNRRVEAFLYDKIRNHFAHGGGFRIGMPNQSALAIRDLAEIINRLWGSLTPGGRLYPTPIQRHVMVVGWSPTWLREIDDSLELMHPEQLAGQTEADGWMYLVVRGVENDHWLWYFDARYELTPLPTELLWGPGSRREALAWLEENAPGGDEVNYLDRVFAVRRHDGTVFPACRPEVLMGLPPEHRAGTWHVVRADFPGDAVAHVRHIDAGQSCGPEGCPVQDIASGPWEDAAASVRNLCPGVQAAVYSEARVPQRLPFEAHQ